MFAGIGRSKIEPACSQFDAQNAGEWLSLKVAIKIGEEFELPIQSHINMNCKSAVAPATQSAIIALVVACFAVTANASFVVPRTLENISPTSFGEGTTGFYGIFANEARVYQFAASELAAQGLSVGDVITGVRARSASVSGQTFPPVADMNWANFTVQLGQAANSIANMSTTLNANLLNPVTVRTGAFTLPANSMSNGSGHTDFGYLMMFTTPYRYQGGDLVFSFSHGADTGGTGFGQDAPNSFVGDGTLYRSLFVGADGLAGTFNNVMTVLKFETVATPEPATGSLFMVGLAGYFTAHRRRPTSHNRA